MYTWPMCVVLLAVGPTLLWIMCAKLSPLKLSPSPLPLFLFLLDETEGAIDADRALQGSQHQFLSVRTSLRIREDV
jgi:hypothetical protein